MRRLNKRGKIAVKLSGLFGTLLILGGMGNVEAFNRLSGFFCCLPLQYYSWRITVKSYSFFYFYFK